MFFFIFFVPFVFADADSKEKPYFFFSSFCILRKAFCALFFDRFNVAARDFKSNTSASSHWTNIFNPCFGAAFAIDSIAVVASSSIILLVFVVVKVVSSSSSFNSSFSSSSGCCALLRRFASFWSSSSIFEF